MSTVYNFVPTVLPASMTLPEDLVDQRSAASVNVPLTTVGNGLAYLNQNVSMYRRMSACAPTGVSGLRAKNGNLSGVALDTWGARGFTLFGERLVCIGGEATEGHHAVYDVTSLMVDGATVTQASVELAGNTSHVPGMMPALGLSRYSPTAGTWQSLLAAGMVDDTSASGAAYAAAHDIRLYPDQNATIDLSSYAYYAVVCAEGGAGYVAGMKLFTLSFIQTARRYQT